MIETIEQEQKTKCGIYAILNKHTDRIYIGQAIKFSKRWKSHQNLLMRNKHRNKFLQNDFNKCFKELGNTDFLEFSIIEIVEEIKNKELLAEREQVYLDAFIPEGNCYNILKKAKVEDKSCFSKNPEETKKKKSESMKKVYENPEFREKMSNALKKNWENPEYKEKISKIRKENWQNPEYREKMSNNSKKKWENPENREKMSKIRKENWENPEYKEKMSKIRKENWENKLSTLRAIVISPDGKEFEVYNICKFARENNLNPKNLNALINGKRKSHKGWTLKK